RPPAGARHVRGDFLRMARQVLDDVLRQQPAISIVTAARSRSDVDRKRPAFIEILDSVGARADGPQQQHPDQRCTKGATNPHLLTSPNRACGIDDQLQLLPLQRFGFVTAARDARSKAAMRAKSKLVERREAACLL